MGQKKKLILYKKYTYFFTWKIQFLTRFSKFHVFRIHRINDFFIKMWLKYLSFFFKLNLKFKQKNMMKFINTFKLTYKFNKQSVLNRFFLESSFWEQTRKFILYNNNKFKDLNYLIVNTGKFINFCDYNDYFLYKHTIYNDMFLLNKSIYKNYNKNFFLSVSYKKCYNFFFKALNILSFKNITNKNIILNLLFILHFIKIK